MRYLLRIKVDSQPVLYVDTHGKAHWVDLEKLQGFCERFLTATIIESARRGPATELTDTSAIDMDLRSVGLPTDGSRASVVLGFGVEDRRAL